MMESSPAYTTDQGAAFCGDSLDLLEELPDESIDLIMTSPPFALQRKKEYGNKDQSEYVSWLGQFGKKAYPKLKEEGSFVLDIGGAYKKGRPARSLHPFRVLLHFCDDIGYTLAEDFYWHNPSTLPGPIEWVNKRKIRAKDSVNNLWWFSKTDFPKADVSRVLTEYSDRMKKLLDDPESYYEAKERPSGHNVSKSFAKDNGGAIPPNLLEIPNSESSGQYLDGCKEAGVDKHPARFPADLPEFFIKFLTDPGDLVVDIFAGSNTTGWTAESLDREWLSFEDRLDYLASSTFRFMPKDTDGSVMRGVYDRVNSGEKVALPQDLPQQNLFA
jgi:site-specific DNA-methyltransferase (cytosine-N4-specific)